MKIFALLIIILGLSIASYSQTEKIAHRSHSGKNKTFRIRHHGNWGITPSMIQGRRKRDSIMKSRADSIEKRSGMYTVIKNGQPGITRKSQPAFHKIQAFKLVKKA